MPKEVVSPHAGATYQRHVGAAEDHDVSGDLQLLEALWRDDHGHVQHRVRLHDALQHTYPRDHSDVTVARNQL